LATSQGNVRAMEDSIRNGDQAAAAYRQEGVMLQV
jgi:hypothetical protein